MSELEEAAQVGLAQIRIPVDGGEFLYATGFVLEGTTVVTAAAALDLVHRANGRTCTGPPEARFASELTKTADRWHGLAPLGSWEQRVPGVWSVECKAAPNDCGLSAGALRLGEWRSIGQTIDGPIKSGQSLLTAKFRGSCEGQRAPTLTDDLSVKWPPLWGAPVLQDDEVTGVIAPSADDVAVIQILPILRGGGKTRSRTFSLRRHGFRRRRSSTEWRTGSGRDRQFSRHYGSISTRAQRRSRAGSAARIQPRLWRT